jgi:hypothetical protein
MATWNILRQFGIFYSHLIYFIAVWYIFTRLDMLYHEKSGNPDSNDFLTYNRRPLIN